MGKLLAILLVISLVGIFSLLFISLNQKPKISGQVVKGDYAQAQGKVLSVKNYEEFSVIKLDSNISSVVCYQCKVSPGQEIRVTGSISDYQGQMQINADKIEILG